MTAGVMCPNDAAKLGFKVPLMAALETNCLCGIALMQEGHPGGRDFNGVMPDSRGRSLAVSTRARFCADAIWAMGPGDRFFSARQKPGRMETADTPSCNRVETGHPAGCARHLDAMHPCGADSCADLATAASAGNTFGDAFSINCGDTFSNGFSTEYAVVGAAVGQSVGVTTGTTR